MSFIINKYQTAVDQTNNHASTPPLNFYMPGALPDAQPTVSKQ